MQNLSLRKIQGSGSCRFQEQSREISSSPLARRGQSGYWGRPGLVAHATPNDQTWLPPYSLPTFSRPAGIGQRMGRRTEGKPCVCFRPMSCPRLPARERLSAEALNSRQAPLGGGGASIDGDDRVSTRRTVSGGKCGSNLLSGAKGFASSSGDRRKSLRRSVEVAVSCGMCNRRISEKEFADRSEQTRG